MGGAAIAVCGAPSMEDARRPGLAVSSGFRGSGFRGLGFGFRGSGFRVPGLGFGVPWG